MAALRANDPDSFRNLLSGGVQNLEGSVVVELIVNGSNPLGGRGCQGPQGADPVPDFRYRNGSDPLGQCGSNATGDALNCQRSSVHSWCSPANQSDSKHE